VIPIGRHSLMHAFVPESRHPRLSRMDVARRSWLQPCWRLSTASPLAAIGCGSGRRTWWCHLERLALPGGVPLLEYLDAVERGGMGTTRWAVFADLCEFIRAPAVATVN